MHKLQNMLIKQRLRLSTTPQWRNLVTERSTAFTAAPRRVNTCTSAVLLHKVHGSPVVIVVSVVTRVPRVPV